MLLLTITSLLAISSIVAASFSILWMVSINKRCVVISNDKDYQINLNCYQASKKLAKLWFIGLFLFAILAVGAYMFFGRSYPYLQELDSKGNVVNTTTLRPPTEAEAQAYRQKQNARSLIPHMLGNRYTIINDLRIENDTAYIDASICNMNCNIILVTKPPTEHIEMSMFYDYGWFVQKISCDQSQ